MASPRMSSSEQQQRAVRWPSASAVVRKPQTAVQRLQAAVRTTSSTAADLERRCAALARREESRERGIAELEGTLKAERERQHAVEAGFATAWSHEELEEHERQIKRWLGELGGVNAEIQGLLTDVPDREKAVLALTERDLLRAFEARCFFVQEQVDALRKEREGKASPIIERTKIMEADLDYTQETCATLKRNSRELEGCNLNLKKEARQREKENTRLVEVVVGAKQVTKQLKAELALFKDKQSPRVVVDQPRKAALPKQQRRVCGPETIKLMADLEKLRTELSDFRGFYAEEVYLQTELRGLLTRFAADIKHELGHEKAKSYTRPTSASAAQRTRPHYNSSFHESSFDDNLLRISASTTALKSRTLTKQQRPHTAHTRAYAPPDPLPPEKDDSQQLVIQLCVVEGLLKLTFPPPPKTAPLNLSRGHPREQEDFANLFYRRTAEPQGRPPTPKFSSLRRAPDGASVRAGLRVDDNILGVHIAPATIARKKSPPSAFVKRPPSAPIMRGAIRPVTR